MWRIRCPLIESPVALRPPIPFPVPPLTLGARELCFDEESRVTCVQPVWSELRQNLVPGLQLCPAWRRFTSSSREARPLLSRRGSPSDEEALRVFLSFGEAPLVFLLR